MTQNRSKEARKVVLAPGQKNPALQAAGRKGRAMQPGQGPGGRKKGTPNRKTKELRDQLIALGMGKKHDHPVIFMAKVYWGKLKLEREVIVPGGKIKIVKVEATPELRVRCAAEVAQYLEPKRKALEISTPPGQALVTRIERVIVDHTKD